MRVVFPFFLLLLKRNLGYEIPEVTRQTLEEEAASHEELLVYFYATWCGPCQSFSPVFQSLAETHGKPGKLGFAKFNGGEDRQFSGRIVGDAYPGVAMWRKGKFYLHARAEITQESMDSWIQQYTGDPVEVFATEKAAKKRAEGFRGAFIASVKSDDDLEILRDLAYEYRHFGKFVAFREPGAAKSSIRVKHAGEKERHTEWATKEELFNFTDDARFPLFGPVDEANQHLYFLRGLDPVMVYGTAKEIKDIARDVRKLALSFRKELSFMWFDTRTEDGQRVAHGQGVYKFPNFVTFLGTGGPLRERKRYVYTGNERDMEELKQWFKAVRAGEIRPQVQSSSRKPHDRRFDSDVVTWVTGDKFEKQVFHDDADFLLMLSAPRGSELFPGCLQCESTLRQLDMLVKKILPKDAPLKVGEMMVTSNEIPLRGWGGTWQLESLPTFYFIPAGQRETFMEWSGKMDLRSILTRWEEDTTQFKEQAATVRQTLMQMEGPIDQEIEKASDKSVAEQQDTQNKRQEL